MIIITTNKPRVFHIFYCVFLKFLAKYATHSFLFLMLRTFIRTMRWRYFSRILSLE